ncbi:hypothetical protein HX858_07325 [Marine Group I thaumarchaeote]|uniref:Uncharacterized protein n=2 Tax=Marine Group I thaumarchaeote TaxID=2511932 RepID=A0A7K4MVK0_9ARCH|nr:hypothetical protein [Marine Group I thaumarchaeote]NWJ57545.1 hypothetical protein [Marine Group I thaumarchaeote]
MPRYFWKINNKFDHEMVNFAILNHVDMDSESSVLGYGISLIILNGMMYLGIPAIVIVGIRKIK